MATITFNDTVASRQPVSSWLTPAQAWGLILLAPYILVFIFFVLYPVGYGLWLARHPETYVKLFDDPIFARSAVNTLIFLVVGINVKMVIALGLSGFFAQTRWWIRWLSVLFILPWAVPVYVTALVWRNMFDSQSGAFNLLFKQLGLPMVDWMSQFGTAFFAVLLTNVWLGFPFMMMVASGGLQAIPKDYYEAASLDGATPWRQFWTITVPMLKPVMVPAITLGAIWTFNNFNVIYFVSKGDPFGKTEILVTQAYKLIDPMGMYGVASAFSILIFLILLALTQINMRLTKTLEEA